MKILFTRSGRCSSFGGPADKGVSPAEGLALIEPEEMWQYRFRHLFLDAPQRVLGLARNLNPLGFYCAMRWDYSRTSRADIRNAIVRVTWQDSAPVWCHPADWGPNVTTGRIIDLSPGSMAALGCRTDSVVDVEVWL